jgi:hypothetical protein
MVDHDPAAIEPHQMEEKPTPLYQKIVAGVVAVLVLVIIILWHGRFSADFYPPDAARVAPNLVASLIQWAFILLVAAFIWPPTRHAIHRFVDNKLAPVHAHLNVIREHHEEAAQERAEIHKKLDQLHAHLGIGEYAKPKPKPKPAPAKKAAATKKS